MATWPPVLPDRLKEFLEIEVVDEDTIKIKKKGTNTVYSTVTKSEFEDAVNAIVLEPADG